MFKAVNCEHTVDGNPCNTCDKCNSSSDIIEIDAASNNGVENIRGRDRKVSTLKISMTRP